MDAILNQIKQLITSADEIARQKLINSLNKLTLSLENPEDTAHRYGHMVSSISDYSLYISNWLLESTNRCHQDRL